MTLSSPRPEDSIWMLRALDLAREAGLRGEIPIGALLVCKDEILGQGANAREATSRAAAHAEMEALDRYHEKAGSWRLPPGTSLYVTAEPCLMCTGGLLWARTDRVVFGCADPKSAGLLRQLPYIEDGVFDHAFVEVVSGVEGETAGGLLTAFFQARRSAKAATAAIVPA